MPGAEQMGELDARRVLDQVDQMILERPEDRASTLRRLREMSPGLYSQWLARVAAQRS